MGALAGARGWVAGGLVCGTGWLYVEGGGGGDTMMMQDTNLLPATISGLCRGCNSSRSLVVGLAKASGHHLRNSTAAYPSSSDSAVTEFECCWSRSVQSARTLHAERKDLARAIVVTISESSNLFQIWLG